MKHRFRKYIGKRGSALFMVLSIMTALIVTCMAMYFSVVSSRKTQYAVFNQQQSYQSAISLNESMLGAIYMGMDSKDKIEGFKNLQEEMFKLGEGEKLTTMGNGFIAFGGTGTDPAEDQVGAYTAEITYIQKTTDGKKLFDVVVTADINGTQSVARQLVALGQVRNNTKPRPRPLPLFVGSGLTPDVSALNAGYVYSPVFYDSEYTEFMPFAEQSDNNGNAELKTMGDIYAAGTLTVNYKVPNADGKDHIGSGTSKDITWVVGNDLIMTNNVCPVYFPADRENRIYVGGDLIIRGGGQGFKNCTIWVLGDVKVESGSIGENVQIFCRGTASGDTSGATINSFPTNSTEDKDEAVNIVTYYTQDIPYYDWNSAYGYAKRNSSGELTGEYADIPGIDKEIEVTFAKTSGTPGVHQGLEWTGGKGIKGITIGKVNDFTGGQTGGNFDYSNDAYKLVIDTGNDPDNVFVVRLKPYLTTDGRPTFSWCPHYGDYATWVIVRGKGSVIFEMADNTTYENRSYKTNVMHEKWADNGAYGSQSRRDQVKNLIKDKWIHYYCQDGCCENELVETGKSCKTCGADKSYALKCDKHNLKKEVCLECEKHSLHTVEKNGKLYSVDTCQYRLEDRGSNTPTMNIFLVMTGQNSRIAFTPPLDKLNVNGNNESFSSFWGYIYAPYAALTYSAKLQSGDKTQFVGGIAVGNFNLFGRNSYMPAYPDKTPDELMEYISPKCQEHRLPTIDSKPWKKVIEPDVSA